MTDASALVPARPRPEKPRLPALRTGAEPAPIEKAAMILTAIGPELAAGFLRELAEPDMERFARALSRPRQDRPGAARRGDRRVPRPADHRPGDRRRLEDGPQAARRRPRRRGRGQPPGRGPRPQRGALGLGAAERHAGPGARQLPAGRAPADRRGHPQRAARRDRRQRARAARPRLRPDRRPAPLARPDPRPAGRRRDPGRDRARLPLGPAAQPLEAPPGRPDRRPDEQHLDRGPRGLPRLPRGPGRHRSPRTCSARCSPSTTSRSACTAATSPASCATCPRRCC